MMTEFRSGLCGLAIGSLTLLRETNLRASYIGFNVQNEPFNDVRVRQAINYAIDTELIVDTIMEGLGIPATGPIGPNVWGNILI